MPIRTYGQALNAVAEIATDNRQRLKQNSNQRRNQVVDIYGSEYTRQGDSQTPAKFYISISPDMVYLERFQFKIYVQPFAIPIDSSATGGVGKTSLSISDSQITPNPHTHTLRGGITVVDGSEAENWRIYVDNIDITAYLRLQAEEMPNGRWITGESGIYPTTDLEGSDVIAGSFDLIEVAHDLYAEGNRATANKLLESGLKEVKVSASAPFQISLLLYLKYSHLNR